MGLTNIEHKIGVLLAGSNKLDKMLVTASNTLDGFQKRAENTANAINSIKPDNIDMSGIEKASNTLKGMGRQSLLIGAGITAGLGLAVRESAILEASLGNLGSVSTLPLDGSIKTLDDGLKLSKKTARNWSNNHVQSSLAITNAQYDLASAGLFVNEVNAVTNQTMAMSSATMADASISSALMSKELKTFGETQLKNLTITEKANVIMDTYAAVVKNAKTTLPDMASGMKAVRGQASNMGLELQETAATIGLLQTLGLEAGTSGTYFAGVLRQLPKAAKQLGMVIEDNNGRLLPMVNIVEQLTARYASGGVTVKESAEIQKLFGDEASKAVQLLIGQTDALRDLTDQAKQSGTAMEMVSIQENTLSAQSQILWNNMRNLAGIIGDSLTPLVRILVAATKTLVQGFASFAEAHPVLTSIVSITAALAASVLLVGGVSLIVAGQMITSMALVKPYLLAIGSWTTGAIANMTMAASGAWWKLVALSQQIRLQMMLTSASGVFTFANIRHAARMTFLKIQRGFLLASMSSLKFAVTNLTLTGVFALIKGAAVGAFLLLKGGFLAVSGAAMTMWTSILWPILPIVALVGVLAGAFYGLYKSFTTSGGLLNGVWEDIKTGFESVKNKILYGVGYLTGMFQIAWEEIQPVVQLVMSGIKMSVLPVLSLLVGAFTTGWGIIKTVVLLVWDVISSTIKAGFMGIYHTVGVIWNILKGVFGGLYLLLTGDVSGAWEMFTSSMSGVLNHLVGIKDAFFGWFGDLGDAIYDAGAGLINAFIDGAKAGWNKFKNGFISIISDIRGYFTDSDAKHGPLSDLTKSGSAMMPTFAKGMKSTASAPLSVLQDTFSTSTGLMTNESGLLASGMTSFTEPILSGFEMDDTESVVDPVSYVNANTQTDQSRKVVFEKGAIQININYDGSKDNPVDFAEQLSETIREKLLELGAL